MYPQTSVLDMEENQQNDSSSWNCCLVQYLGFFAKFHRPMLMVPRSQYTYGGISFHDSVWDQLLSLMDLHLVWISPPWEYPQDDHVHVSGICNKDTDGRSRSKLESGKSVFKVDGLPLVLRDGAILSTGVEEGVLKKVNRLNSARPVFRRNFDLEVMEFENIQNNALAKLPMLKLGEYEMWEIRIKQYFQIQDYALWEVIENGNSWEEMVLKWEYGIISLRGAKAPRSKDNRNWNQGSSSKAVKIEDASEKAMCAIDGAGFDWSDMADEEIQDQTWLLHAFLDLKARFNTGRQNVILVRARDLMLLSTQIVGFGDLIMRQMVHHWYFGIATSVQSGRIFAFLPIYLSMGGGAQETSREDGSLEDNGTADQQVNTARPEVNFGSRDVSTVVPEVNTASLEDLSTVQTRRMTSSYSELGFLSAIYEGKTHKDLHTCLFCLFLSQEEPKRVSKALSDPTWVEAMQEELLQFKLQKVWILVDLPKGHRAIGTKWVYRNKKDERGIVIRNKARLIEEEVYVCQPPGFEDPDHPDKVYKVVKALYGMHQAPVLSMDTFWTIILVQMVFKREDCPNIVIKQDNRVQQRKKGIFISQDKYVHEILRKFNYSDVKSASTPTDLENPLVKDGDADDVDEHLYRSMIGSLMYLTASRPDIMFAVCACVRFQVSLKTSHLLAVKRIFRYLKGKPSLGLWYSKDSPLELVAYTDSDYAGASLDRKSTTRGCQFLGNMLISWQCKKQTVVATSTTKAEYVAAASCCGQVLWIQNQLLDYGYNFMNTVIYINNTSTICIIENPVQHSKTKHIEIRHHFIRDCNAKKLIQMAKIDTQHNVADLLTKGFDAGRFQYLVSSIRMLNP
ncbi:putative ribonuclease H-like domain-containing protein [Tanacetum coccineum]